MTDKEKVLAKWPGAYLEVAPPILVCYSERSIYKRQLLSTGPTESEAWASAAKGLE